MECITCGRSVNAKIKHHGMSRIYEIAKCNVYHYTSPQLNMGVVTILETVLLELSIGIAYKKYKEGVFGFSPSDKEAKNTMSYVRMCSN